MIQKNITFHFRPTLILVLLFSILVLPAMAQKDRKLRGDRATIDGVTYRVNKKTNEAYVSDWENGTTDLIIKPKVTIGDIEYNVTEIRTGCSDAIFNGIGKVTSRNVTLKSVVIPEGIRTIGIASFRGAALSSLILPNSVKKIEISAFADCTFLESVVFPDTPCQFETSDKSKAMFRTTVALGAFGNAPILSSLRGHTVAMPKYLLVAINESKDLKAAYERMQPVAAETTPVASQNQGADADNQQPVATVETQEVKSDVDLTIPAGLPEQENTFAMIIGNENYERVSTVEFARKDANTFAEYCHKTLGLPKDNIRKYDDATYGKMQAAIQDMKNIAEAYNGEIDIIVYYAGHGIPDGQGNAFLLPVDADGSQTNVCLSTATLYDELNKMQARSVVVFMDACFSGAQRGDGILVAARGVAIKTKPEAPKGNCVVFTAASDDETAFPYKDKGHGMFTYFLLKKLQESHGNTTLGELADYITTNVKQKSIVKNRKAQTPTILHSPSMTGWRDRKLGGR